MTVRYYFLRNLITNAVEETGPTFDYLGEIGDYFGDYLIIDYAEEYLNRD